jgi:hypothetical protein
MDYSKRTKDAESGKLLRTQDCNPEVIFRAINFQGRSAVAHHDHLFTKENDWIICMGYTLLDERLSQFSTEDFQIA